MIFKLFSVSFIQAKCILMHWPGLGFNKGSAPFSNNILTFSYRPVRHAWIIGVNPAFSLSFTLHFFLINNLSGPGPLHVAAYDIAFLPMLSWNSVSPPFFNNSSKIFSLGLIQAKWTGVTWILLFLFTDILFFMSKFFSAPGFWLVTSWWSLL